MEDLDDNISLTGFDPLFIKEEDADPDRTPMEHSECNTAQSGLTFAGTQLNQSVLMKPYLQEMDELLNSCEELTGMPFGSNFSASYNETRMIETTQHHIKEEDTMEIYTERISPQPYLSTSYIDTNMDGVRTEDQQEQGQPQGLGTINRCGVTTDASHQREMPLTSAGNKLSETMVAYEGQLLGMLAMLENCMEEAGMDFEPQDWASDGSQEYVHISKNPQLCRGTTLVPIQQVRPKKLETKPMQLDYWDGQHAERDAVSKEARNTVTESSATNESQQAPVLSCDNIGGSSMERLEKQKKEEQGLNPVRFLEPSMPINDTENDLMQCEATKTEYISTNEDKFMKGDITGIEVDDTEMPAEEGQQSKMDTLDLESGMNDLGVLWSQMEECIDEVQRLEKRRKELLAEVLELRGIEDKQEAEGSKEDETEEPIDSKVTELMNKLKKEEEGRREERKREIQSLREERAEEEKRMWKVNLERLGLQEELRKLKRRLFTMARDCAHNQVSLNTQQREVELLRREEVRNSPRKIIIHSLHFS